jgi:hypothetical protein
MLIINNKTMYIHIPKTSGTNLRYVFAESTNNVVDYNEIGKEKVLSTPARDLFWEGKDISDLKNHPFLHMEEIDYGTVKHAPLWVWQKTGDWKNHNIITTCRNPYTRAVSLYKEILQMAGRIVDPNMSFEEFLNHPTLHNLINRFPHNHTTNQIEYLKDVNGDIKVDKIYKVETDMSSFARTYKLKGLTAKKNNLSHYEKNYSKIYTDFLINWVQETYADDFEFFGYSKDPFWTV